MMYIHYCRNCNSIRVLSGHKPICPACDQPLKELKISFEQYAQLNTADRSLLLEKKAGSHRKNIRFHSGCFIVIILLFSYLILTDCHKQKYKRCTKHLLITKQVMCHISRNTSCQSKEQRPFSQFLQSGPVPLQKSPNKQFRQKIRHLQTY